MTACADGVVHPPNSERVLIRWFRDLTIRDVSLVGGKNASLGELYRELGACGVKVPNGFAITADAYWYLVDEAKIYEQMQGIIAGLDPANVEDLRNRARELRFLLRSAPIPSLLDRQIRDAYRILCAQEQRQVEVAVRSSATAEDLPNASFAGQQETYLNIQGEDELLLACRRCFASLFTERAISYRAHQGFDHMKVALSVGVQKMVRSDLACAGVMFSIDTESGFRDVVLITGAYGLGENVVQGTVNPDEFYVFKPTLLEGYKPIIAKHLGNKKIKMIYGDDEKHPVKNVPVGRHQQLSFTLSEDEILTLAKWACAIEQHYSHRAGSDLPMDIEWAKDGLTGELYIVQARPETVISQRCQQALQHYSLTDKGEILAKGRAVGQAVGQGPARIIVSAEDISKFRDGEVLITDSTDPDWEPIMKRAKAVVTNRGGRTSHAAIVSRELGLPCIVGTSNATEQITEGQEVTVSCCEGDVGKVYAGLIPFKVTTINLNDIPRTKTKVALNIGNPESAFALAMLPNDGVGLAREEFIISATIGIHPRALLEFAKLTDQKLRYEIQERTHGYQDKGEYFVDKLAEGIGTIAAAFFPKPVIVRLSDFKSNEYAHLLGGNYFEPKEENPMIGFRGACRYYSLEHRKQFALECAAIKRVREDFGLINLQIMVPFCRTIPEAEQVLEVLGQEGLKQGERELKILCMCEIPSNVLLADQFLDIFDGFSIGSNDLTQLCLGIDRDSSLVAHLFDERNEAVKILIRSVIATAKRRGKYIGICGDAPSTFPDFAAFLVEAGIETISLSPDALLRTLPVIAEIEGKQ